jgi:hypothetical protein
MGQVRLMTGGDDDLGGLLVECSCTRKIAGGL